MGRNSILTQPTPRGIHPFHQCMVRLAHPTELPGFSIEVHWKPEMQWWPTDRKTTLHELTWIDDTRGTCVASWGVRRKVKCCWRQELEDNDDDEVPMWGSN
jgi:hypothetical protein